MPYERERGRPPVKRAPAPRGRRDTARPESAFEGDRIAKVMARVGLCSRRDAEEWVRAGRVTVNNVAINDPALNVTDADLVTVDGQPLAARDKTRLFLFNKPRGLVTTNSDPEGRPTVFDFLAHRHPDLPRLLSVGRLDITTEGLLLLTNDGGLARVLELPSTGWLRRYRVRAHGTTTAEAITALQEGVTIEGVDYQPIEASLDRVQGANVWLTVSLREGKNREVRRVLEYLGLEVNRLIRISYGPFQLGEAPDGAVEEVKTRVLMDQLGPTLIAQAQADFSALRREEERDYRRSQSEEPPPKRDKPIAGKRKHVAVLRDQTRQRPSAERVRTERGATEDRRGRAVKVERKMPVHRANAADETRNGRRFRAERQPARDRPDGHHRDNGRSTSRSSRDERASPKQQERSYRPGGAEGRQNRSGDRPGGPGSRPSRSGDKPGGSRPGGPGGRSGSYGDRPNGLGGRSSGQGGRSKGPGGGPPKKPR